jgi:hypothetical protein
VIQGGIKKDKTCLSLSLLVSRNMHFLSLFIPPCITEHTFPVSLYPSLYHGTCISCLSLSLLVSRNMHFLSLFIPPCITEHAFLVSLYPSLYHGTCFSCRRNNSFYQTIDMKNKIILRNMFISSLLILVNKHTPPSTRERATRRDKERQEMHVP